MNMRLSNIIIISAVIAIAVCSDSCISTTSLTKCSRLCQPPEGECLPNGYCLCKKGYTGPDNRKAASDKDLVEASHCLLTCNDNKKDPSKSKNKHQPCLHTCDVRCKYPSGTCETKGPYKGKCKCWWGHTGPNGFFIEAANTQIYADYCKAGSDCPGWAVKDPWCADKGIPFAFYN